MVKPLEQSSNERKPSKPHSKGNKLMSAILFANRDDLSDYLVNDLGMSFISVEDNLIEYYAGEGLSGSIPDMEYEWLGDQGQTERSTGDRWYAYLGTKGYTGSLWDRFNSAIAADDLLSPIVFEEFKTIDGATFKSTDGDPFKVRE